jgi:serine/threonine protein kinase
MVQKYSSTCSHANTRGTVRWQAPELLRDDQSASNTRASDVYAFGSVLYEVIMAVLSLLTASWTIKLGFHQSFAFLQPEKRSASFLCNYRGASSRTS